MSGQRVVRRVEEVGRFFASRGLVEVVDEYRGQIWIKIPLLQSVGSLDEKKAAALSEEIIKHVLRNAGLLPSGYDFKLTTIDAAELIVGLRDGTIFIGGWIVDDKGNKALYIPGSLAYHKEKAGDIIDFLRLNFDVGTLAYYLRFQLGVSSTPMELMKSFEKT